MASSPDRDDPDRPWWNDDYSVPALAEIRFPRLAVAGIVVAVLAILAGIVLTVLAVFVLEPADHGASSTVESSWRSVHSDRPPTTST